MFSRRGWQISLTILILMASSSHFSCGDHGLEANFFRGTIKGRLQINTSVPDTTDEIRVAVSETFPPSSIQEILFSERIAVKVDTAIKEQAVTYDLQVPLGTYDAAFVLWKARNQSWQITDIVGVFGNLEQFDLRAIVLTESEPTAENVDITLDLQRVDRQSSISGSIDFVGDWPVDTQIVALVVYKGLTDLGQIPPGLVFIPNGAEQFDYAVGLAPGTYSFIFVAWLPVGEFDLAKLRVLGLYIPPGGQALVVPDSSVVTGIDVIADFTTLRN